MDAELKQKWVAALRSGEYKQCQRVLHDGVGYCCIGVLEAISGLAPEKNAVMIGEGIVDRIGGVNYKSALVSLNDNGKSFSEIADYIEKNL